LTPSSSDSALEADSSDDSEEVLPLHGKKRFCMICILAYM
jgi:hypothetical protein